MSDDVPQVRRDRSDFRADLMLVPNLISLGRIVGVLVAVSCMFLGFLNLAVILGVVTGLSDYLDGYLARKLNQTSQLGALLDLLADMLAAFFCLILAVYLRVWPVYLLIAWGIRDMGVLAMRASAAQQGFTIPSSFLGKVATNFTGYACILLGFDLVRPFSSEIVIAVVHWVSYGAIHVGIVLQWISGILYLRAYAARYRRTIATPPGPVRRNPEGQAVS